MRRPSRPLLVLHRDPAFLLRLQRLDTRLHLIRAFSWDELSARLLHEPVLSVVVVDPYFDHCGCGPAVPLLQLRRAFPSATVVAAMSRRPGWLSDARTLGEAGVAEVIDLDTEDSVAAIRLRLGGARGRPLRAALASATYLRVPGRARVILDAAVEVAAAGGLARELARTLALSPPTLVRWCRGSGLPVPRELLRWLRVLLAAEMLDDPGRPVLNVALSCGYASDRVLRRALLATVGAGPRALRQRGALATAQRVFMRRLRGRE